jgi:hypothetical protein
MKVEVIVGLPASGKTHLIRGMKKLEVYKEFLVIDDVDELTYPLLVGALQTRQDLIIADPYLCITNSRKACERIIKKAKPDYLNWTYFSNDKKQCLINSGRKERKGRKVENLIEILSKEYVIPEGAREIEVYKL